MSFPFVTLISTFGLPAELQFGINSSISKYFRIHSFDISENKSVYRTALFCIAMKSGSELEIRAQHSKFWQKNWAQPGSPIKNTLAAIKNTLSAIKNTLSAHLRMCSRNLSWWKKKYNATQINEK